MRADSNRGGRAPIALGAFALALALFSLALAPSALAGPPTHLPAPELDIAGFNHACGAAVDSEGDVYVASAGESKVKVFNPAHTELTSIANANEPCGLAVDSTGNLYVSEKATGNVVKYAPNAYPFAGTPTYGAPTTIDSSGEAEGIAVDPFDDRLYVAEGSHVAVYESDDSFETNVGGGVLSDATGVAAYTYPAADNARHLFVADDSTDVIRVFAGASGASLNLRETIDGSTTPDGSLGFGASGAYLAADEGYCPKESEDPAPEQACTAGHVLVYDATHEVVDEFEASGRYVTQVSHPEFADAEPTAIAVDRSGGPGDGTMYVTSGASAGAKMLAFGALAAPSRPPLLKPLSLERQGACGVTVDSFGNRYVAVDQTVFVYPPTGETPLTQVESGGNVCDVAVDSTGKVYALLNQNSGAGSNEKVHYYTPSSFPPQSGTVYARHEPPVTTAPTFPGSSQLTSIGINPVNGHLFVSAVDQIVEFDSADNGSGVVDPNFGCCLRDAFVDIAVYGANENVYVADSHVGKGAVRVFDPSGTEVAAQITGVGSIKGSFSNLGSMAVDQSTGHALVYGIGRGVAEEYEASGAFVSEFGSFSQAVSRTPGIAVDNSGGPSDGNVYVAFDDPTPATFDLTAFGPLSYGEPPFAATGTASGVGGGDATLNGTVDPRGFELEECRYEYLTDAAFEVNIEAEDPPFQGAAEAPCVPGLAEIGSGTEPVPVHADLSGLDPDLRYRIRLYVENKYGSSEGEAGLFGPPRFNTQPALPVAYTEATLRAMIDPSGLETKYHFEYGVSEAYGQSTATTELSEDAGLTEVEVPILGLAEGTTYHFRVVVENEAKELVGPDQSLETLTRPVVQACPNQAFRIGLSAKLPDCRAYELVTPADTGGSAPRAAASSLNSWLVAPRGAAAGNRLGYFIEGTSLPGFDGNGRLDGYRAQRGAGAHPNDGWNTELFGPSYLEAGGAQPALGGVASDQLHSFWAVKPTKVLEGSLKGAYLRTPAGFEPLGQGSLGTDPDAVGGFLSPAGEHVVFISKAHLEEGAAPAGTEGIYDRAAGDGDAEVVSLKPGGASFGGGEGASYRGASEDGETILFEVGGALYLRHDGESLKVADGPNAFAGVSTDGSRVFYAKQGDLHLFDAGNQLDTEIAPDSAFVHVSADGSRVYFTSKEVLDEDDEGVAGEHNLYLWDGAVTHFVAVLDPQDLVEFEGLAQVNLGRWLDAIRQGRGFSPTRSTPDGSVFVFQSHASLTPYDAGGHSQVYRYEAITDSVLCLSCDPTGAPVTSEAALQSLAFDAGSPVAFSTLIPNLTEDGKAAFFTSEDPLLPEDANSVRDVYEWKAQGAEGCKRPSGCLALISSGQGEHPSHLYSMTPDGSDVFFTTREKLVGQDLAGSPSIYDARVEGGIPDPPVKAPCQGDACQGQGSIPPSLPVPLSHAPSQAKPPGSRPCPKGKRRVARRGKTRCVKRHAKQRRAKANRGARK